MKRVLSLLALMALAVSLAFASETKRVKVTGWVSDESCGATHREPGGEDCVAKCIKGAPHLNPEWVAQRMVFVLDGSDDIWFVSNPESLRGQEGKHLRIEGLFEEDRESIEVLEKKPFDD